MDFIEALHLFHSQATQSISRQFLFLVVISIVVWVLFRFILKFSIPRLEVISARSETHLDNIAVSMLRKTYGVFVFFVIFYLCSEFFSIGHKFEKWSNKAAVTSVILQGTLWTTVVVEFLLVKFSMEKSENDEGKMKQRYAVSTVSFFSSLILWAIASLLVLDNFGVNISALIAGLGVGGIAIALATQNILGDLFASISILFDNPFSVGDSIEVNSLTGKVEKVGLKTTHIRSTNGELIIYSNNDLLKLPIRNHGRASEKRILFTFAVDFQTPSKTLKEIPQKIKVIINAQTVGRFVRCNLRRIADKGFEFDTVYFIPNFSSAEEAALHENICIEMIQYFESLKIQFAYPTRTLYIEKREH